MSLRLKSVSYLLITLLLFSLACSSAKNIRKTENEPRAKNHMIVGTWELQERLDMDSTGWNAVEVEQFELLEIPIKKEKTDSVSTPDQEYKETLVFNSSGEAFNDSFYYGFKYEIQDSVLNIGRKWRIIQLNDSTLRLLEIPGEFWFGDSYKVLLFKRVNSIDKPSTRAQLKSLLIGEWQCDYQIQVKTEGEAFNEVREIVTDTIGEKIDSDFYLSFDSTRYEMGRANLGAATVFEYDVADSMIKVERLNFFTILEITQDSLTLLGMHTPPQQKAPIAIWKMYRTK